MWAVVAGVLNILYLILKNYFEKDTELRKEKEKLHEEASIAIKSGDVDRINSVIVRLKQ